MTLILSIIALVLALAGIERLFARDWLMAIVFFVAACVVGPAAISISG